MGSCFAVSAPGRSASDHRREHPAVTFAQELMRCLRCGLNLQYQEKGSRYSQTTYELPVYYKRTHGQRTDVMQGLDALGRYSFKFEDGRF